MYGMATAGLGRLGPSLGYGLYVGGTVLFSNLVGWIAGEWRGASPAVIRGYVKGLGIIVAGIVVIAIGVAFTG
jgi:L-rhamnose-H+ transport protein